MTICYIRSVRELHCPYREVAVGFVCCFFFKCKNNSINKTKLRMKGSIFLVDPQRGLLVMSILFTSLHSTELLNLINKVETEVRN